ncbi:MAG: ABC transporter ATP-binding protein [Lautropia sp.]
MDAAATPAPAPDAVRLDGVSYRYPGSALGVTDIDLAIAPGELLVCVGPSGCGKTTLLRLIAGFLQPDRGRILLHGADQAGVGARARGCGIVFQSYALFPLMRAWENVAYPLRVRGVPPAERRERAQAMLELVGLAAHAEQSPARLSGGQQQRVALARALAFEPKALLLDEPLSALDASTRLAMRDEILRIQRQQRIATLLITHDQDEALSMGDRVAVLREGRLEQLATPRLLYDQPANAFVAGFVGRANLLEATVRDAGTVDCAFGPLRVVPHDRAAGSRVRLLIRPERIMPGPAPESEPVDSFAAGHDNRFAVTVMRDAFHGAVRQLQVAVGGFGSAPPLQIETTRRDAIEVIAIPPDAIQLLPAERQS